MRIYAAVTVHDLTTLEIEVKATCEPFSVVASPPAIHVPGPILVETSVKKPIQVRLKIKLLNVPD